MLTVGKDRTFLHTDVFHEAYNLTPDHLVTINGDWYVLGKMIQQGEAWIVPLQKVERPKGIGPIRTFVANDNGDLV